MQLYGFATEEERELFLLLLGVQSVGPKMALGVLSGGPPRELTRRAGRRRHRALPGRAGHRQAHGRADRRRAAREGRRAVDRHHSRRGDEPARRWRATASSSSASRPPRPRSCWPPPRARRVEELIGSARCEAGPPMSRIQTPEHLVADEELERSLRPRGPGRVRRAGRASRSSSRSASRPPPPAARRSTTSCSPARPGLGKTSLAQILAAELDVPFVMTAGPALERKGDIAAFLTALEPRSVFFVDELHRLSRALEETFYPAMEDRKLPITVGQGAGARVVTLDLPPFTLVGATTRAGPALHAAARPLRHPAPPRALRRRRPRARSCTRSARILEVELDDDRRARDRRAQPRHAARGQPAAQARARLRGGADGRRRHRRGGRPGARPARDRRARASTASTARSSTRSACASTAARSGCRRSRSRWGRSRTRSRTSTSPTCSSRACSSARRAAAWRPRRRTGTSASSRRTLL